MYDIILATITSFIITFMAIPTIIKIAIRKGLLDNPNERKLHGFSIPNLGGIAITAGFVFSIIFWTPFTYFGDLQYILCAVIVIFLIGAKDDIDPLSPDKKFFGQILAVSILIFKANIVLSGLHGIFSLYEVHYFFRILLTFLTVLVIINAFNFIDGVDGLCGSIGLISSLIFGFWFLFIGRIDISIVAFSLSGGLFAFLKYNYAPAKIFMGDTGSMLIGLVLAVLALLFIETNLLLETNFWKINSAPSIAIAILFLPLFDLLRVMIIRIIKKKSPFKPDRFHLHHILVDKGYNHRLTTLILVIMQLVSIIFAFYFQALENSGILTILFLAYMFFVILITYIVPSKLIETNQLII